MVVEQGGWYDKGYPPRRFMWQRVKCLVQMQVSLLGGQEAEVP